MNNTNKTKALISIIAILLLTNISMLVFVLRMPKNGPAEVKKPGFSERIRKEVKFDSAQIRDFEARKKAHWDRMRIMFDTMTSTKEQFYRLMYDPSAPDSLLYAKASLIGQQQKEIDLHVIGYFKDVRKICTSEQLTRYDSLLPDIIKKMTEFPRKR